MHKRTLVVVTCLNDLQPFGILLTSIKKYLQSCPITIIWNEESKVETLQHLLTKYNIQADILLKQDFWTKQAEAHLTHLEYDGWIDQQVMKLAVARFIDTPEYVCIDSKNFFIEQCSIDDIKQVHPLDYNWCSEWLQNWIKVCCKRFKVKVDKLTQNTTPYIVNTRMARQLVKSFKGVDNLFTWFSTVARRENISPSEFFLYEIYTVSRGKRNLGQTYCNQNTLWDHHWTRYRMTYDKMIKETEQLQELHNIKISGYHNGLIKFRSPLAIYKHYDLI